MTEGVGNDNRNDQSQIDHPDGEGKINLGTGGL
jgi:hypothetical protein